MDCVMRILLIIRLYRCDRQENMDCVVRILLNARLDRGNLQENMDCVVRSFFFFFFFFFFFYRDLGKIAKASLFSVQQQNIITIFVTHCSYKYIIAST